MICEPKHLLGIIDLRKRPRTGRQRWYAPSRVSSKKKTICFHHTAVSGGFGVSKQALRKHAGADVHALPWLESPRGGVLDGVMPRAAALADRYDGLPYHAIYTHALRILYILLPFDWVTWHASNRDINTRSLGFAWDGDSRSESPPVAHLHAAIRYVLEMGGEDGHDICEVSTHNRWANKPHCPGAVFDTRVLDPLCDTLRLSKIGPGDI